MKRFLIIFLLFTVSCENERIVKLPAIESSQISEVLDVSPAYIFYDETQIDSVLFNRKNLIGTTNWLVNVDKRLSLKQVIPHLQYLQNKRRKKGMHTNDQAKNYFTCNDLSKNTLGFVEFTKTEFTYSHTVQIDSLSDGINDDFIQNVSDSGAQPLIPLIVKKDKSVVIGPSKYDYAGMDERLHELSKLASGIKIRLYFEHSLNFQDYISFKQHIDYLASDDIQLDTEEFIF